MVQRVATLYFTTNRIIGDVLREVREDAGMTQREVEERSEGKILRSTLCSYEGGHRTVTVERLLQLAALYAIPADVLMSVIEKRCQ